jgi:hypothetical protein
MSRKTFYTVSLVIIMIITGYFAVQVYALPETECIPYIGYECMSAMEAYCANLGRDHVGHYLYRSWCYTEDCYGTWKFFCGLHPNQLSYYKTCKDEGSFQCE